MEALPKYIQFCIFNKLEFYQLVNFTQVSKTLLTRVSNFCLDHLKKTGRVHQNYDIAGEKISSMFKPIKMCSIFYLINNLKINKSKEKLIEEGKEKFKNIKLIGLDYYINFHNQKSLVDKNLKASVNIVENSTTAECTVSEIKNNDTLLKFTGKSDWFSPNWNFFDAGNKCLFHFQKEEILLIFDIKKSKNQSLSLDLMSQQEISLDLMSQIQFLDGSFCFLKGIKQLSYGFGTICTLESGEEMIDENHKKSCQSLQIIDINNFNRKTIIFNNIFFENLNLQPALTVEVRMISKNVFLGITVTKKLIAYNLKEEKSKEIERLYNQGLYLLRGITSCDKYLYLLCATQLKNKSYALYFRCFEISKLFNENYNGIESKRYLENEVDNKFSSNIFDTLHKNRNKFAYLSVSDYSIFTFSMPNLCTLEIESVQENEKNNKLKIEPLNKPSTAPTERKTSNSEQLRKVSFVNSKDNLTESTVLDSVEGVLNSRKESLNLDSALNDSSCEFSEGTTDKPVIANSNNQIQELNNLQNNPKKPVTITPVPQNLNDKLDFQTPKKNNLIKGAILITEVALLSFGIVALCASLGYPMTHTLLTGLSKIGILGSSGWITFALVTIGITGGIIYRYQHKRPV